MTKDEHIEIHKTLHKSLDSLVADYIGEAKKLPSQTNLLEFINWSYSQTKTPTIQGQPHE